MALPGIKQKFIDGNLATVPASQDSVSGLVCEALTVAPVTSGSKLNKGVNGGDKTGTGATATITLGTPFLLTSLEQAEEGYGITAANNVNLHEQIRQFYLGAEEGTLLWVMPLNKKNVDIPFVKDGYAEALIRASALSIRILGLSAPSSTKENFVANAAGAQTLAERYMNNAVGFVVGIGREKWSGSISELQDYGQDKGFPLVEAFIGQIGTTEGVGAALGYWTGYSSALPVDVNVARVADGQLDIPSAYFTDGSEIHTKEDQEDAIHDRRYMGFRTFPNKSGFFFSDDRTMTGTGDLSKVSLVRVTQKVMRLQNTQFVERLNSRVVKNPDGTISEASLGELTTFINQLVLAEMLGREINNITTTLSSEVGAGNTISIKNTIQPLGEVNTFDVTYQLTK